MNKIRVFISSAMRDLKKERDAVEQVVGQMGAECLRAETYHAPGKSSFETCMEMARDCDIFIGIYGQRYGSRDRVTQDSVSELEYEEAYRHRPRKILIYVKKCGSYQRRQADFLRSILRFREGYFRHEYFSSLKQLKKQVRLDLIAWIAERVHLVQTLERESAMLKLRIRSEREVLEGVIREYALPSDIK